MAFTLGVGPVTGGSPASSVTSFDLSLTGTTAGRSIVVGVAWTPSGSFTAPTTVDCSGESSLTWVAAASTNSSTGRSVRLAYLANIGTGGDKTITINLDGALAASNYCVAFAVEFAGGDTSGFFDVAGSANGNSATPTVNVTTTGDNALIVAIANNSIGGSPAAGTGYTLISLPTGGAFNSGEYDLDVGTAGSKTADFSITSNNWAIQAAAFNLAPPPSVGTLTETLPVITLSASGETGEIGTIAETLPLLAVDAGTGESIGTLDDTLPSLVNGASGLTGETGLVTEALPVFVLVATGTPGDSAMNDLPLFTLEAVGYGGSGGVVAEALPLFTLEATGINEVLATAELVLPLFTLSASSPGESGAVNPLFTLEAYGYTGTTGAAALSLPAVSHVGIGSFVNVGVAELVLPLFIPAASGLVGVVGTADLVLPSRTLATEAFVGGVGTAELVLPYQTHDIAGYIEGIGSGELVIPVFVIEALGSSGAVGTYRTWVINLRTRALTEYKGLAFNSYAKFGGAVLAASSSGIVVLGPQTTDNGTNIDGLVRTARNDFGSGYLKRIPRLYMDYSSEGHVEVRTITSEDGRRRYLLAPNGIAGQQQRRVPIGKGPKSRFWQFELANRDGADFALGSFLALPVFTRRRIQ